MPSPPTARSPSPTRSHPASPTARLVNIYTSTSNESLKNNHGSNDPAHYAVLQKSSTSIPTEPTVEPTTVEPSGTSSTIPLRESDHVDSTERSEVILSLEQRDAVYAPGPSLLYGRSGTGKATVLLQRILHTQGTRGAGDGGGHTGGAKVFVRANAYLAAATRRRLQEAGEEGVSVFSFLEFVQMVDRCIPDGQRFFIDINGGGAEGFLGLDLEKEDRGGVVDDDVGQEGNNEET